MTGVQTCALPICFPVTIVKTDGRVVSNFIVQVLTGNPITIYGKGTQTRSFCFVDDLIEGLVKLFENDNMEQPVNLGNPTPINMVNLAHEIIELTNSKSEIVFKDLPQDDPIDRLPDITIAKKVLNWEPRINRIEGLKRTIDYFESQIFNAKI